MIRNEVFENIREKKIFDEEKSIDLCAGLGYL